MKLKEVEIWQNKVFKPDEIEQPVTIKKEQLVAIRKEITDGLSLFYNSKYSSIEFKNDEKYTGDLLVSRYNNYLALFKQPLE